MSFEAERNPTAEVPGVSFFRNRIYDQRSGRWTQEDPIGVAGGLNLYQFNQNNPVMYTDPFGLRTCPPDCGAIHAVAGTAFGVVGAVAGGTVGTAGGPGGVVVGAVLGGASGFGAGVAAGNVAEAVGEAGAQAMGKIGRAIRTLVTGAMIGGSAVVPGTPEGGDATQGGTGTRSIPGSQAPPAPPVVRPDTGTKAPPNPDEQVP
jgi:RHS repeat-associated protein